MKVDRHIALLTAFLFCLEVEAFADYRDHRSRQIDSVERAIAANPWRLSPQEAPREELEKLVRGYKELMWGYLNINGERAEYAARKVIWLSDLGGWSYAKTDAFRLIGQQHWAMHNYDSAAVYFRTALEGTSKMEKSYPKEEVDNVRSAIYGALGNLYNEQDSVRVATHWYSLAEEIFKEHGWKESLTILYYNEAEMYRATGDKRKALGMDKKALAYAMETGDSLMVAIACKGLSDSHAAFGHYRKAIQYAGEAIAYFKNHDREEAKFLTESIETLTDIYRKQRTRYGIAAIVLLLLAICFILWQGRRHQTKLSNTLREKDMAEQEANKAIEAANLSALKAAEATDRATRLSASRAIEPLNLSGAILTDKEKTVLRLLSRGKTSKEIANLIYLSTDAVNWYRKKLIAKFGVKNTAELLSRLSGTDFRKEPGRKE